jgi:hypothetical protein
VQPAIRSRLQSGAARRATRAADARHLLRAAEPVLGLLLPASAVLLQRHLHQLLHRLGSLLPEGLVVLLELLQRLLFVAAAALGRARLTALRLTAAVDSHHVLQQSRVGILALTLALALAGALRSAAARRAAAAAARAAAALLAATAARAAALLRLLTLLRVLLLGEQLLQHILDLLQLVVLPVLAAGRLRVLALAAVRSARLVALAAVRRTGLLAAVRLRFLRNIRLILGILGGLILRVGLVGLIALARLIGGSRTLGSGSSSWVLGAMSLCAVGLCGPAATLCGPDRAYCVGLVSTTAVTAAVITHILRAPFESTPALCL